MVGEIEWGPKLEQIEVRRKLYNFLRMRRWKLYNVRAHWFQKFSSVNQQTFLEDIFTYWENSLLRNAILRKAISEKIDKIKSMFAKFNSSTDWGYLLSSLG